MGSGPAGLRLVQELYAPHPLARVTLLGGEPVLQDDCINCHGAELAAADGSHPQAKFTDPSKANRLRDIGAGLGVSLRCAGRKAPDTSFASRL